MSYTKQILAILQREADKVYIHPRTGIKDAFCSGSDKVHDMPPLNGLHLAGCPRVPHDQLVNARRLNPYDSTHNKPTGQMKTHWGDRKSGYGHVKQQKANSGSRFLPPQAEDKTVRGHWRVL